jgi:hypothetical protein
MIEKKLIVGRFINFPTPVAAPPGRETPPGSFVLLPPLRMTIRQSTGLLQKTSSIVRGTDSKDYRNFRWLEYFPGFITEIPFCRVDVLTGEMSGCWIVLYKREGIEYVGHIGTFSTPTHHLTLIVRNAWMAFATNVLPGDVIAGFNPLDPWRDNSPAQLQGEGAPAIYGLVTASREFYSIWTYKQPSQAGVGSMLRIAGIQRVESASRREIQELRRG